MKLLNNLEYGFIPFKHQCRRFVGFEIRRVAHVKRFLDEQRAFGHVLAMEAVDGCGAGSSAAARRALISVEKEFIWQGERS
jgi:hypothetical protein